MNRDVERLKHQMAVLRNRLSLEHDVTLDQAHVVVLAAQTVLLAADELPAIPAEAEGEELAKLIIEMLMAKAIAKVQEMLVRHVLCDICLISRPKADAMMSMAVIFLKEEVDRENQN